MTQILVWLARRTMTDLIMKYRSRVSLSNGAAQGMISSTEMDGISLLSGSGWWIEQARTCPSCSIHCYSAYYMCENTASIDCMYL